MAKPAYLVTGDDDVLLQRATETLLEQLRGEADVTVETVDVQEAEGLPEMRTASLFGGRTVVVVREDPGNAGKLSGALKDEIEDYLQSPDPDAVLVLVTRGTGHIRSIAKAIDAVGRKIEAQSPKPWDTKGWTRLIGDEFRRRGREADARAQQAILDHAGHDAALIVAKVAQVAAGVTGNARITADDVERFVEGHGSHSSFDIADAVAARDGPRALVELRGALEAGGEPVMILGAITSTIRQLLLARSGENPGGPSFKRRQLEQQARDNFGPGELAWAHDRLAQADLDLKGDSDLPAELVLEFAIIDLVTPREVGLPFNPIAG